MALQLTTAYRYDPGAGAPVETYTHVKMVHFALDMDDTPAIIMFFRYGTRDADDNFIKGKQSKIDIVVKDIDEILDGAGGLLAEADPMLSILIGTSFVVAGDTGKTQYDVIRATLWNYLLDNGPLGPVSEGNAAYFVGVMV